VEEQCTGEEAYHRCVTREEAAEPSGGGGYGGRGREGENDDPRS